MESKTNTSDIRNRLAAAISLARMRPPWWMVAGLVLLWAVCALGQTGAEHWFAKGLELIRQKRLDQAIEAFARCIAADPAHARAYNSRGAAFHQAGDLDKAIADYSRALGLDPALASAFNNRGAAWYQKGDYHRAVDDFTAALRLRGAYAQALVHRGLALTRLGRSDEAAADFQAYQDVMRRSRGGQVREQASPRPYTVQVGAFQNDKTALQKARDLIAAGHAAFTSPAGVVGKGSPSYQVFIGTHATRSEADTAAAQLLSRRFRMAKVKKTDWTVKVWPLAEDMAGLEKTLASVGIIARPPTPDQGWALAGAFETEAMARGLARKLMDLGLVAVAARR